MRRSRTSIGYGRPTRTIPEDTCCGGGCCPRGATPAEPEALGPGPALVQSPPESLQRQPLLRQTVFGPRPFLFGQNRRLLCLPNTGAFVGWLQERGPVLHPLLERGSAARLRMTAIASRLHLLERLRLTPEGYTLAEMKRLTRALLARGQRTFVLSLHSPSVAPGNTPYVRSEADLARLLERLRGYLTFFRDELHGRFVTPHALKAELERLAPQQLPEPALSEPSAGLSPGASRARSGPAPSR